MGGVSLFTFIKTYTAILLEFMGISLVLAFILFYFFGCLPKAS